LLQLGGLEGADHGADVVAIDRTHVGEAQLLEHGAHLGHRQAAQALLEVLQLGRQLAVQEGQAADRLLGVALQELHRFAQPHAVEMGRKSADRRADRHVVVVEHHQQAGLRQVASVVDRLQGHAAGEGAITDHGHALEVLAALVAGQSHAQGRGDRGGGVAGAEVVEAALAALEVAGDAVLLAKRVETVPATGDQLVGVGLVPHIPDDTVTVEVEGLVERKGQFDHAEAGAEVAATG